MQELVDALNEGILALSELSRHPAFEGDAPEFNLGGIGYDALETMRKALAHFMTEK